MAGLNPTVRFLETVKQKLIEGKQVFSECEELDGIQMIPLVPAARIAEQREKMIIRPDDVFIATYSKCGTAWMQQIVKLIVTNGVENNVDNEVFIPWHEQMFLEEIESMPSPRYFKSHLPYQLMPGGGDPEKTKAKYICMIRNPKDLVVSTYNHVKVLSPAHLVPPWEVFFNVFMEGNISHGSFHSHFLGWWAHKDAPNVLFLTYEQLKRNLRFAVISVAEFLGYHLSDEVIDKIVLATSFENMKDNKAANKEFVSDMMLGTGKLLNKGIVGNWKSVLTAEQSAKVDTLVAEKFYGSGIVFDYGDD